MLRPSGVVTLPPHNLSVETAKNSTAYMKHPARRGCVGTRKGRKISTSCESGSQLHYSAATLTSAATGTDAKKSSIRGRISARNREPLNTP